MSISPLSGKQNAEETSDAPPDLGGERDRDVDPVLRSIDALYDAIRTQSELRYGAFSILQLRDWFNSLCEFDPRSGDPLPRSMSDLLHSIRMYDDSGRRPPFDHVERIVRHAEEALTSIIRQPRQRIIREHVAMPVYAVKEMDEKSLLQLARMPGSTLRGKLSGSPRLNAVARKMSIDTAENQLSKAFAARMAELLRDREVAFMRVNLPISDDMRSTLLGWLDSDENAAIGPWRNTPPNNALLNDRNYRRIWDAWLWLQKLDEDILRSHERIAENWVTVLFWEAIANLNDGDNLRIAEQVCVFDTDSFEVHNDHDIVGDGGIEGLIVERTGFISALDLAKDGTLRQGKVTLHDGNVLPFKSRALRDNAEAGHLSVASEVYFRLTKLDSVLRITDLGLTPRAARVRAYRDGKTSFAVSWEGETIHCSIHSNDGQYVDVSVDGTMHKAKLRPSGVEILTDLILTRIMGPGLTVASKEAKISDQKPASGAITAIDLAATHPDCIVDGKSHPLSMRMISQVQHRYETIQVEVGRSNAIALWKSFSTVSLSMLFADDDFAGTEEKHHAATYLTGRLKHELGEVKLTYIVPDAADDFVLERLRKPINSHFKYAHPLPRSVAAVFTWQSSSQKLPVIVGPGDCILVADFAGAEITLTPLVACDSGSDELAREVPESKGIVWVRYPSIHGSERQASRTIAAKVLEKAGCPYHTVLGTLLDLQGITEEIERVSWTDEKSQWFTIRSSIKSLIMEECKTIDIIEELRSIEDWIHKTLSGSDQIYVLCIGNNYINRSFSKPVKLNGKKVTFLGSVASLAVGGSAFSSWQNRVPGMALWKDRLPDLSIRVVRGGRFEFFPLVASQTITPRRGELISIPVRGTFVLEAERPHYEFPLVQEGKGADLHYSARLTSTAFPLKDNVRCRLEMIYRYGEDSAYELAFLPEGGDSARAGFKKVVAEWREQSPAIGLAPAYPPVRGWGYFSAEGNDTIREIERLIGELVGWCNFVKNCSLEKVEYPSQRGWGEISQEWKRDSRGGVYSFAECSLGRVFCHARELPRDFDPSTLSIGAVISFDVEESRQASGSGNGTEFRAVNVTSGRGLRLDAVKRVGRRLRYYASNVWSGGTSLGDPDAPESLRDAVVQLSEQFTSLEALTKSGVKPDGLDRDLRTLMMEIRSTCCCLHKDAPGIVVRDLGTIVDRKNFHDLEANHKHIGNLMGDLSIEWQIDLLGNIFALLNSKDARIVSAALAVLGVVVWRSDDSVRRLDLDSLRKIIDTLQRSMEYDLGKRLVVLQGRTSQYASPLVTGKLELLLGLLRTRTSEIPEEKGLFRLGSPNSKRFAELVEKIGDAIPANEVSFRGNLRLDVQKPQALSQVPDLLYSLNMFLTGQDAANAIQVLGTDNDDSE